MGGNRSWKDKSFQQMMRAVCAQFIIQRSCEGSSVPSSRRTRRAPPRHGDGEPGSPHGGAPACSVGLCPHWTSLWTADKHELLMASKRGGQRKGRIDKLSHKPNYRRWFVSLSEQPSTMRFVTRFFFFFLNPHLSALMFWLMCVWFVRQRLSVLQ